MGEDMWTKGEGMWVRARACRGHVGGGALINFKYILNESLHGCRSNRGEGERGEHNRGEW